MKTAPTEHIQYCPAYGWDRMPSEHLSSIDVHRRVSLQPVHATWGRVGSGWVVGRRPMLSNSLCAAPFDTVGPTTAAAEDTFATCS